MVLLGLPQIILICMRFKHAMSYLSFRREKRFPLLLAIISLAAGVTNAQDDSVRYVLPPITVTATRIAEPWLEVPLALNVVNMKDMQCGKGSGLDEILFGIPGVLAQSRYGNQDIRLSIRGFGARGAGAKSNAGTTRGIRVMVDGFPETEPDGRTSMDLIDLSGAERVEVVRSNASSVWGNASGGVVNVISYTAFDSPFINVQSSFGSFGFHKEFIQTGAMLDAGRFFLSMSNTTSEGWRTHSASTQALVNTGIVSPLGERTSLGVYLAGTSNLFRIPGPLSAAQYDALPGQADSTFIKRDERRFNRLGRIGFALTHDLDLANHLSTSAFINAKYLQRSERGTFRDFNRYHVGGNFLYRNNVAFSDRIRNIFLAGADEAYQDGAIHFYSLTPSGDRGTTLKDNKREGANTFGVFVQDEVAFGEKLSAIGGVRYDNITYSYDSYINPGLDDRKSFEHFTPKLGLTLRLSPTHSIYANLGGGVEVPAGNETDPSSSIADGQLDTVRSINPLLEPITSTTIELGTKQVVLLSGDEGAPTLVYDVALYWLEVRNDIIPYDDGGFYFTAGKTRRMGLEAGGNLRLGYGLSITPSLTLSDNVYLQYVIDSVHYDNPGRIADLGGNKMAGVPDFFYSVGIRFAPPDLRSAYVQIRVQGVGKCFADDRNRYEVPSYNILNAGIGVEEYRIGETGMFLRAFCGINNLTDGTYPSSVWINPQLDAGGNPVYLEPGLPRNLIGSVSVGMNF